MVKTPTEERLKKLVGMRNKAKQMKMFKVSAKLQVRINNIYKTSKNKSILEWK